MIYTQSLDLVNLAISSTMDDENVQLYNTSIAFITERRRYVYITEWYMYWTDCIQCGNVFTT